MSSENTTAQQADLQREVADLIVQALNLDVAPEDIKADDPLYGDGLGLDSIDVLEIALVVSKRYGLQLRAGYEVSPNIVPFVDVLADTRVYDVRVDSSGIRRDSDGLTLSAGATIALTRFVSGEVSAGLQHRTYNDPTLRNLTAPVMSASLIWTASPLTTVRLNATAGVVETSVPGSSGVLTQAVTLEAQHDLLRNLSLIGGITYVTSDYDRVNISERGFSATARLDYRFNRWLSVRGSYIYQQVDSSVATASFRSNTWLLGLRVSP